MARIAGILVVLLVLFAAVVYWIGSGGPGDFWEEGEAVATPLAAATLADRERRVARAASDVGAFRPKQILFGDLHVHTSFSPDAFAMSLGLSGGSGAKPVSHACDYARFCSALDFWSVNDHAVAITPWKWDQTVEAIRQCEAISGGGTTADVTPFLGWEWTQMGTTPDNHYGHKNVVLRGVDEVPDRPVAAASPQTIAGPPPSRFMTGLLGVMKPEQEIFDLVKFNDDMMRFTDCPLGVPVRDQEPGCRDAVATPAELFERLDDWGHESIVIPHGTSWGMYTPLGSSWDKQLRGDMHDPERQTLFEIFSGHGNSEEYRDFAGVEIAADGTRSCPAPSPTYLPSCWRAGELIQERCKESGGSDEVCLEWAAEARQNYVDADVPGHLTVQGSLPDEWLDSGQCTDCFQPSFNYRPKSSAQYVMAIRNFDDPDNPRRFDFGFMASSDNHTARPGTGYKEYGRLEMTEARLGVIGAAIDVGNSVDTERLPRSVAYDAEKYAMQFFATREAERAGSFFMTGGLIAAHSEGRGRDAIWESMQRKEVYGTSGPRILLWFDMLNPPGSRGETLPMGSETRIASAPIFQARAVGSFEQKPGCPAESETALGPDDIAAICGGECYHPSDVRRRIERIEVVRIRPQNRPDEAVEDLIEDPWQVLPCGGDPAGCTVTFTDADYERAGRDTLYYVRAIEAASPAVGNDPLGCTRDATGRCTAVAACKDRADDDDCLSPAEERAWSSPIFVEFGTGS